MPPNGVLEIIADVCIFLILVIPIITLKWIYNEYETTPFKRLRKGFWVLIVLSVILALCNHFISKDSELKVNDMAKDLKSLKDQLPANGFIWDSTRSLIKSLYGNPVVIYRDTTDESTDVVLCATDQMKFEIKSKEADSIWITANFCTTRAEVKDFSISDRVIFKRGNDLLVSKANDEGILNQNWQYGTHDFSAIAFNLQKPFTLQDTIIYYCKFNWSNKGKGMSSAPRRLMLIWDNNLKMFGFLTNPYTIDAVTQALKKFNSY